VASKSTYYIAAFIGSTIGGYIPTLWGESFFSFTSVLLSAVGGIVAIIIVFKFFSE
jgi:uncharacterized membrane protein YeaQ/YmgE (transglycosylase-associated protein family)